jgi:hypothetical protein
MICNRRREQNEARRKSACCKSSLPNSRLRPATRREEYFRVSLQPPHLPNRSCSFAPPCPLCGDKNSRVVDRLFGATCSQCGTRTVIPDAGRVVAHHAGTRGVHVRMSPRVSCVFLTAPWPAGARFYEALSRRPYYGSTSAEFLWAARWAKDHNLVKVLDIGCGNGFFLDLLKPIHETYGLELNPAGAVQCQKKGHETSTQLLHEFAGTRLEQFDLVTAFQVLEHAPAPIDFLRDADSRDAVGRFHHHRSSI